LDGSLHTIVTVSIKQSYPERRPLLPLTLTRRHPLPPLVVGDNRANDNEDADDAEDQFHSTIIIDFRPNYRPTTITVKLPGMIGGLPRGFSGVGAGRGPKSAVTR
jgi:hypothetical protein